VNLQQNHGWAHYPPASAADQTDFTMMRACAVATVIGSRACSDASHARGYILLDSGVHFGFTQMARSNGSDEFYFY